MRRTRAAVGSVAVAALAAAWIVWRSTGGASEAEADAPASPTGAPPRLAQRDFDRDSSEETGDSASEAPSGFAPTKIDRSPAKGCAIAFGHAPGCDFLEPDQDTLLEMARCGIARLDAPLPAQPELGVGVFPKDWLEKAGVGETEHQRLEQAAAAFMAEHQKSWGDLAASVGIDRSWAETTVPSVVTSRIAAEFDDESVVAAVARVAHERAGLTPDDAEVPAALEAAVRLRLDTGDAFEAAIAGAVGEARAAELRAVADGWPGAHTNLGNRCDADPLVPFERRVVPETTDEAKACIDDIEGQGCSFMEPTQLERDRMAECGIIRFNLPVFIHDRSADPGFPDDWADTANLTPQEAAVLVEINEEFRESLYRELTALALQAGKSNEWIAQTPFLGLVAAIDEGSPMSEAEAVAMLRRLAAEQAGWAEPPSDLSGQSLAERFHRITMALGDELEKAVAERLGPERADALRRLNDGWPGPRVQSENHCDGGPHQLL